MTPHPGHSTDASTLRPAAVRSPRAAEQRLAVLRDRQQRCRVEQQRVSAELAALTEYLSISDGVATALDKLSEDMFGQITRLLEDKLSLALQDVLEQPIQLKAERSFKRNTAALRFHIERDGQPEDIMKGQGGSVANVLSVGLRMFALATLNEAEHRRFLVLDEQDCWLRPDLVPRLVKIVHEAGRALGFQVLMISHHDLSAFEPFADRIYRFQPDPAGLRVTEVFPEARSADAQP